MAFNEWSKKITRYSIEQYHQWVLQLSWKIKYHAQIKVGTVLISPQQKTGKSFRTSHLLIISTSHKKVIIEEKKLKLKNVDDLKTCTVDNLGHRRLQKNLLSCWALVLWNYIAFWTFRPSTTDNFFSGSWGSHWSTKLSKCKCSPLDHASVIRKLFSFSW